MGLPNHPFYVPTEVSEADGSHWLQAGSLRKGAMILLASGIMASVDTAYTYAATAPVYNFEIAEHHNYYVGERGVLVHNGNCIVEYAKEVPAYKHGMSAQQVTDFVNDVLQLPNGQNILHRIGKGEIYPKAYNVVKKHALTKVGDEDILASITARAKQDLDLFYDLDNKTVFDAFTRMRHTTAAYEVWDLWKALKEEIGTANIESIRNYVKSKAMRNSFDAGKLFEKQIGDLLSANDPLIRNAIALKLQKMGYNIKLGDYDFVKDLRIKIGTKTDGSPIYTDIDFAYVKEKGDGFEVIPIDAKNSIDAPATDRQKEWLDKLGNTRNFTTPHQNGSLTKLKANSNIEIKATLRIDGPIGNYQVNQFVQ